MADSGSGPGELLLITGKAFSHATAGLCPAASYRASPDYFLGPNGAGRYQIFIFTKNYLVFVMTDKISKELIKDTFLSFVIVGLLLHIDSCHRAMLY